MRMRAWSPSSMVGSRRRRPRPNSCISAFGPKASNTSRRSASVSLSSDHSSWLRTNFAHWSSAGRLGSAAQTAHQQARVLAHHAPAPGLVEVEVEPQVQLVAVLVAEEAAHLLGLEVDLAHQDRVAACAGS